MGYILHPLHPFVLYLDSSLLASFYTSSVIDDIHEATHLLTRLRLLTLLRLITLLTLLTYITYSTVYIYIYIYTCKVGTWIVDALATLMEAGYYIAVVTAAGYPGKPERYAGFLFFRCHGDKWKKNCTALRISLILSAVQFFFHLSLVMLLIYFCIHFISFYYYYYYIIIVFFFSSPPQQNMF